MPVTSTAHRTLRPGAVRGSGSEAAYRELVAGPGEEHLRIGAPTAGEVTATVRIGHMTDLHLADLQSPLRMDFVTPDQWAGPVPYAFRPQEMLATRAVAAAVETLNALAPDVVVQTGDAVDNCQRNEVRSYLSSLRGGDVDPLVGEPHLGPLAAEWPDARVWQPERPGNAYTVRFGLPVVPGILQIAAQSHASTGLQAPWFAVRGNHDVLVLGTARLGDDFDAVGRGAVKPYAPDVAAAPGLDTFLEGPAGIYSGAAREIHPSEERALLSPVAFSAAHRGAGPGPVSGHGLASSDDAERDGRYVADAGERFRFIAFDTNNMRGMWDGILAHDQLAWIDDELARASRDGRLAIMVSHHGSDFLANDFRMCAEEITSPAALIDTLLRHRSAVAWLNGHHHGNQIRVHPRADGSGVAEITTSSLADWPCQVREVQVDELADGIRITTTMHHAAIGDHVELDTVAGLARLHHELAANQFWRGAGRPGATGEPRDRNIVLTLPHPR